jgi:4-aminobutyrate aminotransferase
MIEHTGREQGDVNLTPRRKLFWQRHLDAQSRQILDQDSQYFLHQALSTPVLNVIKGASGAELFDLQGRSYLDMHGNGVHNAGFNNPHVVAAVRRQLEEELTFCPRRYTNQPAIRLAEKLARLSAPEMSKTLFAPGGSQAIEMALMLARVVTGKNKTISYWDVYHGTGFGAASISGEAHFRSHLGPLVPGTYHVEYPHYVRHPWGQRAQQEVDDLYLRQIEIILERDPEIGALIAEPVTAMPQIASKYYWQRVRQLCDNYGVMLIFDEIIVGLGRSGKMFAYEHYVVPDILVLGKSLGGGVAPLAAIHTHAKYDVLQDYSIGHFTHEKNPLSAAAGLAEIEYIEENNLVHRSAEMGDYFLASIRELQGRHPMVGNADGLGLMLGFELLYEGEKNSRAVDAAEALLYLAMEKGLAFKCISGNVITLRPALLISREQIDRAIAILDASLDEVENGNLYQ